jgi:drug/metabolite transporter (DMT)-like permease
MVAFISRCSRTWSVTSLSFISVFTPVVALLLGFVFLGERPTALTAVGAVLILGGVGLALTGNKKAAALGEGAAA